jgi:hypothetical protein
MVFLKVDRPLETKPPQRIAVFSSHFEHLGPFTHTQKTTLKTVL